MMTTTTITAFREKKRILIETLIKDDKNENSTYNHAQARYKLQSMSLATNKQKQSYERTEVSKSNHANH